MRNRPSRPDDELETSLGQAARESGGLGRDGEGPNFNLQTLTPYSEALLTSKASEQLCAPAARRTGGDVVLIRLFGDEGLRRQNQGGDRPRVAHGAIADLHRVYDSSFDHVDGLSAARVKAVAVGGLRNLGDGGFAIAAAIGDDAGERMAQRALYQCGALFGRAFQLLDQTVKFRRNAHQSDAAAGHNALFDCSARCVDRIFDQLHFTLLLDWGGAARQDHRRATRQLRETLLEFIALDIFRRR